MSQTKSRLSELQRVAWITIWINVALTLAKLVIGLAVDSIAVISDAIHTFSDVFTTIFVIVGLKFSSRAADRSHPYGHQRIESIVSLFMAFVLGATALFLGYEGIMSLLAGGAESPSTLAVVITAASILVKEWMYRYTVHMAKKHNSTSMMSDAWHHRSDAISSIAVLVGVCGSFFGWGFLEPLAAIAVCVLIFKVALDIGITAVNQLMDKSAGDEAHEQILNLALSVEGVCSIDLLNTRISNNLVFVDMEIVIPGDITVAEGHAIAQEVKRVVEESELSIGHCMVHVHPE